MEWFPATEPHDEGLLDVGAGHKVHWTVSGNPDGVPALIIHGGPGSGGSPGQRRMWDPERYRVIQMDQRHCGNSTPSAADPTVLLTGNTTHDLVNDMELLRQHLGVGRWVLWGASWGTTLALHYAERHPDRVRALILVFMMLARRSDLRWLYQEMGRYFPEEWARFRAGAGQGSDDDLLGAYNRLLNETQDEAVQRAAAQSWCDWEDVISSLDPGWQPNPRYQDPGFRLQFSRITTHYFSNDAWLEPNQILREAHRLDGIPGVIIHGRADRSNPYDMAWLLSRDWPSGELITLSDAGHTPASQSCQDAILAATSRFVDAP